MFFLTTRFNNETWNQNREICRVNQLSCVYGVPQEMTSTIFIDARVFVIEMNNDKNRIEGIGSMTNRPKTPHSCDFYSNKNFNRYVYIGNIHFCREELMKENKKLVDCLDNILFKGKTHMKRGCGLTTMAPRLLGIERCGELKVKDEILKLFRSDLYIKTIDIQ
jgi:hypothetical protein